MRLRSSLWPNGRAEGPASAVQIPGSEHIERDQRSVGRFELEVRILEGFSILRIDSLG